MAAIGKKTLKGEKVKAKLRMHKSIGAHHFQSYHARIHLSFVVILK